MRLSIGLLLAGLLSAAPQEKDLFVGTRTLLAKIPTALPDGPYEVSPEGRGTVFLVPPLKNRVQAGTKISAEYASIGRIGVLADGRPIFAAVKGKNHVIVAGEEEGAESTVPLDFVLGPGARRFAYQLYNSGDRRQMVIDHQPGPLCASVSAPLFSADGLHVAYIAEKMAKRMVVVVDGKEGEEFSSVGLPLFSPDGTKVAYTASQGQASFAVVDGVRSTPYDGVSDLAVGPEGKNSGFVGILGQKRSVVVNGKAGKQYDDVRFLLWSADRSAAAYVAVAGGKLTVVVGEKEGPVVPGIEQFVLSADGRTAAGILREGGKMLVLMNDKKGPPFLEVSAPVVSADGSIVAYAAMPEPGKMHIMVNGTKGPVYERVERPVIAAKANVVAYRAIANRKGFVTVAGVKQDEFIQVDDPILSPDGSKVAYLAHDTDGKHLVVGKKKGEACQDLEPPFFTAGGQHAVARARLNNLPVLAVDEKVHTGPKEGGYLWLGPVTWSRNGSRVAFPAVQRGKTGRELWWEVVP